MMGLLAGGTGGIGKALKVEPTSDRSKLVVEIGRGRGRVQAGRGDFYTYSGTLEGKES